MLDDLIAIVVQLYIYTGQFYSLTNNNTEKKKTYEKYDKSIHSK